MKYSDKKLGMDRDISRRDFVHGVGVAGAGLLLSGQLAGCEERPASDTAAVRLSQPKGSYPPSLTGMRGNHDGAFDVAHALGREGRTDFGPVQDVDELYDLVIVGGGISGLSAAHFYRKKQPDARILILDNHDDFGGHAKRNEFTVDGRTLIAHGGSETMVEPSKYSAAVKSLLDDLGVDPQRFYSAYDQGFEETHGLKPATHFSNGKWGVNRLVPRVFGGWDETFGKSTRTLEEDVAAIPISLPAQEELRRLLTIDEDQIPHIPVDEKPSYLSRISYHEFVTKHLSITEPEVLELLSHFTQDIGLGIKDITAARALSYALMPGWNAAGLPPFSEEVEPYIHHFPDGNASIARLQVRSMIAGVADGESMEDIVTSSFDYSKLDQRESPVRIRLNSTAIKVEHEGDAHSATHVHTTYVQNGTAFRVKAKHCVLACYNAMIPHLCPELPQAQREALALQVKQPLLYTNVVLRNWSAWKKLGISRVYAPGAYHDRASLIDPVSLGDYQFSNNPDEPAVVIMYREGPRENRDGLTPREQFRMTRYEMLTTPFEDIERHIREQLQDLLGEAGFNAATDIAGITVNRWAHGYAYMPTPLHDEFYADVDYDGAFGSIDDDERWPHVRARKTFGRIAIANSDAAAWAMLQAAIEQAHRAVEELQRI